MNTKSDISILPNRARRVAMHAARIATSAVILWAVGVQAKGADLRTHFVDGDGGIPLAVRETGPADAPAILFIHGLGQGGASFQKQFEALGKTYHLVAFDLRGHGVSGKPWDKAAYSQPKIWANDVAAVVRGTALNKPIVVGWSYGAGVAIDYVREYGIGAVSGLMLVSSVGGMTPPLDTSKMPPLPEKLVRARVLQRSPLIEDQMKAAALIGSYLTEKPATDDLESTSLQLGAMVPPNARSGVAMHPSDNRDMIARLTVPVLLVRGDLDPSMPHDPAADLAQALPNGALVTITGGRPLRFPEDAAAFNAALVSFVEAVKPPRWLGAIGGTLTIHPDAEKCDAKCAVRASHAQDA